MSGLHDHGPAARRAAGATRTVIVTLGLVAVTALAFAPVRQHAFVNLDDPQYVLDPNVSAGLTWPAVRWAFTTAHAGNWHPLTWLSHMLDVQLWGLDPGPHHVVNALLHLGNALLLFGLLRRMTGAPGRSAFVAALFAVHPLHVESVAWVAERKDVLSTFLALLTLSAYLGYARRPLLARYAVVCLLFGLGLMAKPMLVTIPFVLLLLDFWPLGRLSSGSDRQTTGAATRPGERPATWPRLAIEKLPLVSLSVASSVVTLVVQQQSGAVKGLDVLPLGRRLANAVLGYVGYVGKALWPARLAVLYPYPASQETGRAVGFAAALLVVSVLVIRSARRRPSLFVGWFWYLGMLVPVIGLVQVGAQPIADRYTYLPLVGLFIMAAWGMPELFVHWPRSRVALPVAAALVIAACAVTARAQVRHWRDSVTLWEHALDVTVGNYRAHDNLGQALAKQGKTAEAIGHYSESLRLNPDFGEAHANLGHALAEQGRVAEAIAQYNEALRVLPDDVDAHDNLGVALVGQGQLDEAIGHFLAALRVRPDLAVSHLDLGVALAKRGHLHESVRHLLEAVRLDPGSADAHQNLALALAESGRVREAVSHYEVALSLRPDFAEAHSGLGNVLVGLGRLPEAVAHYEEALRLRPDLAEAHNGLGVALAKAGRIAEAIAHYEEALRLRPELVEARSNLGMALAAQGRIVRAIQELVEALRVAPDDADLHYDAAVMFARNGQIREAVRHFEAASRLDPGHQAARAALQKLRSRGRDRNP